MSYDIAFQAKVWPTLRKGIASLNTSFVGNRVYLIPPEDTIFPCIVYQSQDLGGKREDTIGENGWTGLVTFRSLSTSSTEADDNLLLLFNQLPNMTASGYSFQVIGEHFLPLPVEKKSVGAVYTSALVTRIRIRKT